MRIKQTVDYEQISLLNQEVQNLHASLYPDYFKEYDPIQVTAFYKSVISNPNYQFYFIELNEQPAGYLWLELKEHKENAFKKAYKSIYVHQISIQETYRSQGFGRKLMDQVEEIAANFGIKKIELDYWVQNNKAHEFYSKNGYTAYRTFVYKDL